MNRYCSDLEHALKGVVHTSKGGVHISYPFLKVRQR